MTSLPSWSHAAGWRRGEAAAAARPSSAAGGRTGAGAGVEHEPKPKPEPAPELDITFAGLQCGLERNLFNRVHITAPTPRPAMFCKAHVQTVPGTAAGGLGKPHLV